MKAATCDVAPAGDLPHDEAVRVHVGLLVRVEVVRGQRLVQHLRRHVALRPLPRVRRQVHLVILTATQIYTRIQTSK